MTWMAAAGAELGVAKACGGGRPCWGTRRSVEMSNAFLWKDEDIFEVRVGYSLHYK